MYYILIYLFVHCKYFYLGAKRPVNIGLGVLNLNCLFTFSGLGILLIVCLHFEIRAHKFSCLVCLCVWWHKSFWVRERMATRKKNDQYDSILNKLGFDANDLIVDITNIIRRFYSWVC